MEEKQILEIQVLIASLIIKQSQTLRTLEDINAILKK